MGYNVKYRLEYTSRGNHVTVIDILKRDYNGGITELVGSGSPFSLIYESSDLQQFSVFKNSYCVLRVKELQSMVEDFKEIADEDDYILKYKRNGSLIWSGYLMAEQFTQNDDPNDPFISLKFYDGISRLKIFTVNDLSINQNLPKLSLAQFFTAVNSLLYSNLNTNSNILFNDFLINIEYSGYKLLDVVFLQRKSFFEDAQALNLYDILTNIASSFNFTYLLYKDRLCITNFEFSNNPKFVDYENGQNLFSLNELKNIDNNHFFINKTKLTTFFDSLKKAEVFHDIVTDPSFLDINKFTVVEKTGTFSNVQSPVVINNEINFYSWSTELAPYPNKDYMKVKLSINQPIKITNSTEDFNTYRTYRLRFKYKMDVEFTVSDQDIFMMNEADAQIAKNRREELLDKTTVTNFFRVWVNENFQMVGGFLYLILFTKDPIRDPSYVTLGKDIRTYIKGEYIELDMLLLEGTNLLDFSFFQPNLHIDRLSAGNNHNYSSVNLKIFDMSLVKVEKIGLEQLRYEGVTNRSVFNYNLNRNKEYKYVDFEETDYKFNLLDANGYGLSPNSFYRRSSDYSFVRARAFKIHEFLLFQYLEQFGFQQEFITGDLMVRNDLSFNIFSTIQIGNKKFAIHRFRLLEKESVYEIELIEIKYELSN